jgi:hypothetical protein
VNDVPALHEVVHQIIYRIPGLNEPRTFLVDDDDVDLSGLNNRELYVLQALLMRAAANVRHEMYVKRKGTSW